MPYIPTLTWGFVLWKAAAYVLAATLFWPKARLTGFTLRDDCAARREVRSSALTEREKGIMNETLKTRLEEKRC